MAIMYKFATMAHNVQIVSQPQPVSSSEKIFGCFLWGRWQVYVSLDQASFFFLSFMFALYDMRFEGMMYL